MRLELPFAAGGCNEGTAGVQPVGLKYCISHQHLRELIELEHTGTTSLAECPLRRQRELLFSQLGIGRKVVADAIMGVG